MQNKAQIVKSHFDEADNYLTDNPEIALRSIIIKNSLPELENKRILDIGCGNGDITLPYINNNKITFLDFSDNMLEIVRSKIPAEFNQNSEFLNIDIDKLSHDKKYDYIFIIGVLAHVSSLEKTFEKLVELIDEDGTIIVQFTNRINIISILTTLLFKIKHIFGGKPTYKVNYTSFSLIKGELKKNKLKYDNKILFWSSSILSIFKLFPANTRTSIYKLLSSKLLRSLGSEVLLFVSLAK